MAHLALINFPSPTISSNAFKRPSLGWALAKVKQQTLQPGIMCQLKL